MSENAAARTLRNVVIRHFLVFVDVLVLGGY